MVPICNVLDEKWKTTVNWMDS